MFRTYLSPSPWRKRQIGMLSGWNFCRRSCLCSGMSMNMTVPIVASTVLCASGITAEVQGPPANRDIRPEGAEYCAGHGLTSHNDHVRVVGQAIAGSNAGYLLLSPVPRADHVLKPAPLISKHELHSLLLAEMISVGARLLPVSMFAYQRRGSILRIAYLVGKRNTGCGI